MDFNSKTNKSSIAAGAAALSILLSAPAAAEKSAEGFEMTVIQDAAYGTEIVAGNLEGAIAGITSERYRAIDAFAARNNLCVALTLNSEFEKALPECNEAVVISRERMEVEKRFGYAAGSRNVALALSNRGVLRLLIGEGEQAREDFHEARILRSGIAAPRRNLQYLAARAEARQTTVLE